MKKTSLFSGLMLLSVLIIACENSTPVTKPMASSPLLNENQGAIVVSKIKIKDKNAKLNVADLDIPFLMELVADKVNRLRKKKRLTLLKVDDILFEAAADQNNYNFRQGDISHHQPDRKKRTMKERVAFYGGKHLVIGENTQFISFSKRITNGKASLILPTYEEVAERLVRNWIKSKPHYVNLIEKSFNTAGTAIRYDAKKAGIYATQVYGKRGR